MNAPLSPVRLGKIGYLNVLPLYHPLERDEIAHGLEIVSGPPAFLNRLMERGELHISAASSIEYARRPSQYFLVPELAIGCCGPVQSVLLLARHPLQELEKKEILVSSQTHTSAALLRLLLLRKYQLHTEFVSGDATSQLASGARPEAILAIGDEALELRRHADYPIVVDLGQEWLDWTGLPFIFGVWIVQRKTWFKHEKEMRNALKALIKAKRWGQEHLSDMCALAAEGSSLDRVEMCSYFNGLSYDLGEAEQAGLQLFYERLAEAGLLPDVPKLDFAF